VAVFVTASLQVMLTYIPGLNWFFGMPEGMQGIQWARVIVCMCVVYVVVEIEKALVDPVLMPIIRPFVDFVGEHAPKFLRLPVPDVIKPSNLKTMAGAATAGCVKPEAGGPSAIVKDAAAVAGG
jgi:hypothetical protein